MKGSIAVIAAVAATFVGLEIGARLLIEDPVDSNLRGLIQRWSKVPRMPANRSWVTRRGVEIHTNALGFRSPSPGETIPPKSPGRLRVAVIGDSETFCKALAYEDCFPGRLERALAREFGPNRFEVFGFAVEGTNTSHHLGILRRFVMPTHPDIVVLNYSLNDIEAFEASRVDLGHWYDRSLVVRLVRFELFKRRAHALREEKLRQYARKDGTPSPDGAWPAYYARLYTSPLWDANLRTLLDMKAVAEEGGAEFLMTTSTEITAVDSFAFDGYPHRKALAALRQTEEEGIAFIDPLPSFLRAGKPGRHYYASPRDAHKNAEGNRLLVESFVAHPRFREAVDRVRKRVGG